MTQKDLIMARADAYANHRYVDGAQGSGPDHNDKRTVWAREVLQEAVVALESQVNTCGSGAGCLHKDARIEALEAKLAAIKAQKPTVWIKYLIGAAAKSNGQCYKILFAQCAGYAPLYPAPVEQAQPEPTGIPFVPWSKEAEMMESWVEQAQPERAPLTDAELETMWASENGLEDCQLCKRDDFIKAAKYFYLKQGGAA